MTRSSRQLAVAMLAGAVTGLAGVLGFGAVHAVAIVPIWSRLLGGLPFGLVAGALVGWAFAEVASPGARGGAQGVRFGALMWALLLPATLLDNLRRAGLLWPVLAAGSTAA